MIYRQEWIARLHDPTNGVPYGVALAAAAIIVLPQFCGLGKACSLTDANVARPPGVIGRANHLIHGADGFHIMDAGSAFGAPAKKSKCLQEGLLHVASITVRASVSARLSMKSNRHWIASPKGSGRRVSTV